MIEFKIGGKVYFSIMNGDNSLFEQPSLDELKHNITSIESFVDRYYELLKKAITFPFANVFNPSLPSTTCALDPSLSREIN